jgi:hypothetical protein
MSFIKLHRKKTVISRTEHGKNVNKCFKKKKSMCNSNKMSAISWRPVLVVEEDGVPRENHRPWASNW